MHEVLWTNKELNLQVNWSDTWGNLGAILTASSASARAPVVSPIANLALHLHNYHQVSHHPKLIKVNIYTPTRTLLVIQPNSPEQTCSRTPDAIRQEHSFLNSALDRSQNQSTAPGNCSLFVPFWREVNESQSKRASSSETRTSVKRASAPAASPSRSAASRSGRRPLPLRPSPCRWRLGRGLFNK
jgi:hypothetical protein